MLGDCATSVRFLEAASYSIATIYEGILGLSFAENTKGQLMKPVSYIILQLVRKLYYKLFVTQFVCGFVFNSIRVKNI